ncbi:adenylate/guanylate cyclase domain-containing protein [Acidobacteriota bacterium]
MLFCDINDFTTLCEGSRLEDIIDLLNEYFTRMERVIFEHKGTLKQFVGDEIMVICGAPNPEPDHAARICAMALVMVDELRRERSLSTSNSGCTAGRWSWGTSVLPAGANMRR